MRQELGARSEDQGAPAGLEGRGLQELQELQECRISRAPGVQLNWSEGRRGQSSAREEKSRFGDAVVLARRSPWTGVRHGHGRQSSKSTRGVKGSPNELMGSVAVDVAGRAGTGAGVEQVCGVVDASGCEEWAKEARKKRRK